MAICNIVFSCVERKEREREIEKLYNKPLVYIKDFKERKHVRIKFLPFYLLLNVRKI